MTVQNFIVQADKVAPALAPVPAAEAMNQTANQVSSTVGIIDRVGGLLHCSLLSKLQT